MEKDRRQFFEILAFSTLASLFTKTSDKSDDPLIQIEKAKEFSRRLQDGVLKTIKKQQKIVNNS